LTARPNYLARAVEPFNKIKTIGAEHQRRKLENEFERY